MQTVVILLLTVMFTGCLDYNNQTVALPTFSGEISKEVIPEEIREAFKQQMPIYEGQNPPDITGEYVIIPMTVWYDSTNGYERGDNNFYDTYIAFKDRSGTGILDYTEKSGNTTSYGENMVVVGEGNNFTAYFVMKIEYDDGYTWARTSTLISGRLTANGIEDICYAFIILEANDPDNKVMDENEYRIFVDGDDLATRTSWLGSYKPAKVQSQENNTGLLHIASKKLSK